MGWIRTAAVATAVVAAGIAGLWEVRHAHAQEAVAAAPGTGEATVSIAQAEPPSELPPVLRPRPRPDGSDAALAPGDGTPADVPPADLAAPGDAPALTEMPGRGPVTNLPLPRFVSLKGNVGNARRGPGLTHRIDWVFTHAGMPLRLTAEHDNWRRVEDAEGMGGWVHYALLSGVRTMLVTADLAEFHARADAGSEVVFKAEAGVIGRILECNPDWCRVNIQGQKGWAAKTEFWGSDPGEIVE